MHETSEPVGRRRFLRLVTGAALGAAAGSPLLTGCGGGGSGSSAPGGNGGGNNNGNNSNNGGQPVPSETRMASLEAVQSFVNGVAGESRESRLTRIAGFLQGRPEFAQSGLDEDGVWAIYPDGVPLMILDNRAPDPVARSLALPPTLTRRTNVPGSRKARLLFTLPAGFNSELPIVQAYLQANGYEVTVDPGTVASLKAVAGDGVFYMGAHGGRCRVSQRDGQGNLVRDANGQIITSTVFGAWTSTPVTPGTVNQFLPELNAGQLGFGTAIGTAPAATDPLAGLFYVFTDAFVQAFMNFAPDSLVWFSACHSNSALIAQPFVAACHAKRAGVYVGWNSTVTDAAVLVTDKFLFSRLLGEDPASPQTATVPKEDPAQRAFDFTPVWDDLKKKGLHLHPNGLGGTTEIKFSAAPGTELGLLAPSIKYVLIDEFNDEAVLRGQFGKPDPAVQTVLINGQPQTILEWTEDRIRIRLERTGPNSVGEVQVLVREHRSNLRHITGWDMTFRYKWQDLAMPELKVDGPMTLRVRADIGTYRERPGEAPKEVLRTAIPRRDSRLDLTASGAHQDGDTTTSWSGSQAFVPKFEDTELYILSTMFLADTFLQNGKIGLALGAPGPTFTVTVTSPSGTYTYDFITSFGLLDGTETFPDPLETNRPVGTYPSIDISFDDNFGIVADSHDGLDGMLRLEWDAAPAQFPPDPRAARSVHRPR